MASQGNMPFIRNLASSDRKIRTSALASLHTFLSAKHISSALGPLDVLKLWKGLFFALWMCDRAIPQQTLCAELADLIFILPREAVVPWLRAFWATMSREWTGIDVLRMEKFLLLARRVVGAGFKWMKMPAATAISSKKSSKKNTAAAAAGGGAGAGAGAGAQEEKKKNESAWDAQRVDEIVKLLGEYPFALEEATMEADRQNLEGEQDPCAPHTIPVGLKIHVLDIWVDEAEKVGLLDAEDQEAAEILQRISTLVDLLEQRSYSPAVKIRSKESLADDRLPGNKKASEAAKPETADVNMDDDDDDIQSDVGSWDGFND
ncbi:nucleolar protein,Nop52-domain-containing protein [Podospora appendiculata]|uniref:Nucleolar protein,Nop52-domain-containing protein n=1 Tax=Podospora appendiculata TaxID=314037 RepID=A0AAE1CCK3_9PEZI|nr:nucleolar protein,Nop52-domain-containing protein [Podospora appendiculata]